MNRKTLEMRAIGLDRFGGDGVLVAILSSAGLELVQAPEGFWAIRVKRAVVPTPPTRPVRKRRLEGRA
jgi:hypothetical protein